MNEKQGTGWESVFARHTSNRSLRITRSKQGCSGFHSLLSTPCLSKMLSSTKPSLIAKLIKQKQANKKNKLRIKLSCVSSIGVLWRVFDVRRDFEQFLLTGSVSFLPQDSALY